MRLCRIMGILALAAVVSAPVAVAEGGQQGDWEIGFFAGYAFLDDYDGGPTTMSPDDDVLFGVRLGGFLNERWSVEGSFQTLSSKTDTVLGPPDSDFDRDSLRLNVLRNFRPGEKWRPFATAGLGSERTDATPFVDQGDASLNVGGGVRWFATDKMALRFDGRVVRTDVNKWQHDFEATAGLSWIFGGAPPGDADGDGVYDKHDKCPDTPRGATVDADGCPSDSDGDGVFDGIDKCPDTPKGLPVDGKGCPKDSDGDGVFDGVDKCPDTPKGATVDKSGCPKDSDGDGVYDGIDDCPDTPKGATVDRKGCPKDSDGDGVLDGIDKCPGTPRGTKVGPKGCKVLFDEERTTLILRGVNFEFNSADLTVESRGILDTVAASLKAWSEVKVEVAGHTDSVGRDAYNQKLSQRRAESVMSYLAGKGVGGSRMSAKGYGEKKPIADNKTDEGRAKNRRVELKKVD